MSKAIALKPNQINKVLDKILLMQDWQTKQAVMAISHAALRVTEIALLEVKDVITPAGKLRDEVFLPARICKGTKSRTVWFSNQETRQAIQEYIDYRLERRWGLGLIKDAYQGLNPDSRLIFNNRGRPYGLVTKKVRMVDGSTQDYKACEALRIMIQGIYDRCGFMGASSHTGRKSFATNAAIRGVDIDRIAEAMGHDDSDMTLKYI